MSNKLLMEMRGHTALITINTPPANTWDEESLPSLGNLVKQLNQDDECYSLVITGQGEKFFSAGADLNMFASGDKLVARDLATKFSAAFETLSQFRGVSIAAINGFAMGGGLECALACDIRIAESHAVMALPEATVGLLPAGLGTQHLSWVVGEGWAKKMILCGERVEEVVEKGQSVERALALAANVEKQSPKSVAASKRLIQAARHSSIKEAYPVEADEFVALFDTNDQAEGVNAFLEKRKPKWTNS
jgi:enoyl-CoA hydratase/carnithine racemase